jgi:UDP-N-acetylglucosamine 1-carboxyvinyltransferase
MDKFVIEGGQPLQGKIRVSGAKNATLPLLAATLLAPGKYRFTNVPQLRDVRTMAHLLRITGVQVEHTGHDMLLDTTNVNFFEAPYDLVKTMRASIYVLGPLLARYGQARVSLPGGCAWGPRPVNFHITSMETLGADIELDRGYIVAKADRLRGATIRFDVSSVGATGNALMAAVLAKGETIIENAAREPDIVALENFLIAMGARIEGVGTSRLVIEGVDEMHAADAEMIPDRIEAGTYLTAAAITGGDLTVQGLRADHMATEIERFREAGVSCETVENGLRVTAPEPLRPVSVTTAIYPDFPTDMQAQWTAMMSVVPGTTNVTDTIYTDRFNHVPELCRLGANISVTNNIAVIRGVKQLTGATVMSTDLRASASLILAGLCAQGTTEILRVYHLDRGYEQIEQKLAAVGARISREEASGP